MSSATEQTTQKRSHDEENGDNEVATKTAKVDKEVTNDAKDVVKAKAAPAKPVAEEAEGENDVEEDEEGDVEESSNAESGAEDEEGDVDDEEEDVLGGDDDGEDEVEGGDDDEEGDEEEEE